MTLTEGVLAGGLVLGGGAWRGVIKGPFYDTNNPKPLPKPPTARLRVRIFDAPRRVLFVLFVIRCREGRQGRDPELGTPDVCFVFCFTLRRPCFFHPNPSLTASNAL
jgi:hypothetical protein